MPIKAVPVPPPEKSAEEEPPANDAAPEGEGEKAEPEIPKVTRRRRTAAEVAHDKAKKEAEVAELTSQKESLQAQLDEDAATNAQQIEHIKKLTVGTLFSTKTMLRLFYACCAQYLRLLVIVD